MYNKLEILVPVSISDKKEMFYIDHIKDGDDTFKMTCFKADIILSEDFIDEETLLTELLETISSIATIERDDIRNILNHTIDKNDEDWKRRLLTKIHIANSYIGSEGRMGPADMSILNKGI